MKTIIEKSNGIVTNLEFTPAAYATVKGNYVVDGQCKHLCWDCKNACAARCLKVADVNKVGFDKNPERYPAIKKAFQIRDSKKGIIKMIVGECENFANDEAKTPEEIAKGKQALENIYCLEFGTNTIEEARVIQKEQFDKGLSYGNRAGILTDKEYQAYKRQVKKIEAARKEYFKRR